MSRYTEEQILEHTLLQLMIAREALAINCFYPAHKYTKDADREQAIALCQAMRQQVLDRIASLTGEGFIPRSVSLKFRQIQQILDALSITEELQKGY